MRERRRRPPDEVLLRVRAAVGTNDREGALALLLDLLTGGARQAEALPEVAANALVATARAEVDRDDADRAALTAYRRAARARDDVLALIQEAPLGTDDLAAIQAALEQRLVRDRVSRQAATSQLLERARQQTDLAFAGRAGSALAIKLGRGYLEMKYIPNRRTGKIYGPYLYERWVEAGRRCSRYVGKPASA